jgi:4,5:9,10-diseco-3-hydroxy-5,9,17-trioxoandrosta-1(10),2-diene-4-oate hydrolase
MRELSGVPEGSPSVEVDGVRIAYARSGQGQTVVCLHAIGHGGRDFEALAASIEDKFEVIRLDWPGQGRSGEDRVPASATRYADLLAGALAALKVERPIIIGNSIGGAAAIVYASRYPVKALVLCNSGGLLEVTPAITRACISMAAFFAAGARGSWWFPAAFWLYYTMLVLPSGAARAQRGRVIASGAEVAPVLRDAWLSFGKPEADLRATAAALDVPVWVAWATGDWIIQLSACQSAIKRLKRGSLTRFGGGHAAFLERPRAFAKAFLAFAKTV